MRFVTDRGTCFTAKVFEEFCVQNGVRLALTSSRHSQGKSLVERVQSVIMATLLTERVESDRWDVGLPAVQRVLENSESKVTTRTAFELLHGYRPRFY